MNSTFSGYLSDLGFPLKNERWSWCALNEERRQAIFTIWEDRLDRPHRTSIDLSWLNDPIRTENGAREFRRVMARVLEDGFAAYGILCEAKDPGKQPRSRKRFYDRDLLALNVIKQDGRTIAQIVGTASAHKIKSAQSIVDSIIKPLSALDDLDDELEGIEAPERLYGVGSSFARDPFIRRAVVKRANGICEFCGAVGFAKADGTKYIETHHIISLAQQGPDTLANVIGLCPSHHREAHYGADQKRLEQAMLTKLNELRKKAH